MLDEPTRRCGVCGQVPSAQARFCRRCGARVPAPRPRELEAEAEVVAEPMSPEPAG